MAVGEIQIEDTEFCVTDSNNKYILLRYKFLKEDKIIIHPRYITLEKCFGNGALKNIFERDWG